MKAQKKNSKKNSKNHEKVRYLVIKRPKIKLFKAQVF